MSKKFMDIKIQRHPLPHDKSKLAMAKRAKMSKNHENVTKIVIQ